MGPHNLDTMPVDIIFTFFPTFIFVNWTAANVFRVSKMSLEKELFHDKCFIASNQNAYSMF